MSDEEVVEEESGAESMHLVTDDISPIAGIGTLVFGKWDSTEVTCQDPGISPYINLRTVGTPHSGGRHANAWMGKAKLSVIERFINGLMRTGRNGGKKSTQPKPLKKHWMLYTSEPMKILCKFLWMPLLIPRQWKRLLESNSELYHNQRL